MTLKNERNYINFNFRVSLLDGRQSAPVKKESTNLTIIICTLSWEEGFRNHVLFNS